MSTREPNENTKHSANTTTKAPQNKTAEQREGPSANRNLKSPDVKSPDAKTANQSTTRADYKRRGTDGDFEYESDEISDNNLEQRSNVKRSDKGSHDNQNGYRRNPNQDRDERGSADREEHTADKERFMNNDEWQKRQEGRFDEDSRNGNQRSPKHQRYVDRENEPRRNSRNNH